MGFPWIAGGRRQSRLTQHRYGLPVVMLFIAVIVYAGIITAGCAGRQRLDVDVVGLASGEHSQDRGRDIRFVVASDPDSFRALISRIFPPGRSPVDVDEIDFESQLVIAALMGVCPTTGYSISFDETTGRYGNALEIRVRTSSPSAERAVAQVTTSPYTLAVVDRSSSYSRIRFVSADGRELRVLNVP